MTRNIGAFLSATCLAIILAGCSTTSILRTEETTVRDSTIVVVPPAISDTLEAEVRPDSVVQALDVRGRDTVTVVRYYPKEKKVTVYARPDTVRVSFRDTVQIVRNEITEKPSSFVETMQYLIFLSVLVGIIVLVMKFAK